MRRKEILDIGFSFRNENSLNGRILASHYSYTPRLWLFNSYDPNNPVVNRTITMKIYHWYYFILEFSFSTLKIINYIGDGSAGGGFNAFPTLAPGVNLYQTQFVVGSHFQSNYYQVCGSVANIVIKNKYSSFPADTVGPYIPFQMYTMFNFDKFNNFTVLPEDPSYQKGTILHNNSFDGYSVVGILRYF